MKRKVRLILIGEKMESHYILQSLQTFFFMKFSFIRGWQVCRGEKKLGKQ